MAPRKKSNPLKDSLATFTGGLANALSQSWYRSGPLVGVKDGMGGYGGLYDTSWLCRAAVEVIPEDCFKRGYQWVAEHEQVNLLEAEERKHGIRKKKKQALAFSRRYGEAYLYFDTGQDATKELRLDSVRKGGLRFVNVLRQMDMSPGEIESDPMSPYFNQPKYYTLGTVHVHPSRICRFVNGEDPDTNRGVSVLQYMLAPILASDVARDNTVALTTEALINVLSVDGLMDAVQDPATEKLVVERYNLMSNMKATNKMVVLDKEREAFDRKPSQFTTLPDVIETMRREVSAAIGIPYSLLFGRAGGIGSNGDMELKNYYDNIATMQSNDIEPACAMLDEVVIRSALGNRPDEVYIDWLSLYEMSDKEKAEVARINAEAVKVGVDSGVIPASMMTEALINSWVESGSFPGVEQAYADWVAAGGWESESPDEEDVIRTEEPVDAPAVSDAAPRTLYVSRKVLNSGDIIAWAKAQGFTETLAGDDLHVTIAYSNTPVDWMKVGAAWESKIEITEGGPRLIETFGEAKVLLFKSSELEWRHEAMMEAGTSWDHPEYQPHITVSYGDLPDNIEPYQGKIILGPEIFEEVDPDWNPKTE